MTERNIPFDPAEDPVMKATMLRLVEDGVRRGVALVQSVPELAHPSTVYDGFVSGAVVSTVLLRAYGSIHEGLGPVIADDWLVRTFAAFQNNLQNLHGIELDIQVLRKGK